jgi:tRNA dimethylallyltransferase
MSKKWVIAVVGPTAVGKTKVSIELARLLKTEIVSADARQMYREMQIGTAVPDSEELQAVRHHFIQSHSVQQPYSVGDYEQEALQVLENLFKQHLSVVVVGGSGLYMRALLDGLDDMPPVDPLIREELIKRLNAEGLAPIFNQLEELDPEFARVIDVHNPQRVIRALEVCLSTGLPYSSFRQGVSKPRSFSSIRIGLDLERSALYLRIDSRVDEMLEKGLFDEAKALYPFRNHTALQTVGYSEIFGFLDGNYSWEEAVRLIKRNSRRYAKRQLTWFRKDPSVVWFHPGDWTGISQYVMSRIQEAGE